MHLYSRCGCTKSVLCVPVRNTHPVHPDPFASVFFFFFQTLALVHVGLLLSVTNFGVVCVRIKSDTATHCAFSQHQPS